MNRERSPSAQPAAHAGPDEQTREVASVLACETCDEMVAIPPLGPGSSAACPRCHHTLESFRHPGTQTPLALSIAALILFACSILFPFLGIVAQGRSNSMSLLESGLSLIRSGDWMLGAVVLGMTIGVPAVLTAVVLFLSAEPNPARTSPVRRWLARTMSQLEHWFLADVFFVGVLVCLTKIAAMARVEFGVSFWSYVGATLCSWFAIHSLDLHRLLHVEGVNLDRMNLHGRAVDFGLATCHVCRRIVDGSEPTSCTSCGARCEIREPESIQRTLAWLFASIVLFVPANVLPMTETTTLGRVSASTVSGSAISMWHHGSYAIASVIFLASVVVPILKIVAIGLLAWGASRRERVDSARLAHLYHITELIGRWSMIDIFVVALLVALIQIGSLLTMRPGPAALAFTGVVICTLLSARSFDPRLLWDPPPPRHD